MTQYCLILITNTNRLYYSILKSKKYYLFIFNPDSKFHESGFLILLNFFWMNIEKIYELYDATQADKEQLSIKKQQQYKALGIHI